MRNRHRQSAAIRLGGEERSRLIPALALCFGLGVWLTARLTQGLWPLWMIPLTLPLTAALRLSGRPLRWACLPLALMAALLWTQFRLNPAQPDEGTYGQITAVVFGEPAERDDGRVAVTLCEVTLDGVPQPGRAYGTLDASAGIPTDGLFDGAAISFQGTVYHPSGKQNEFDFDFRLWLLQNGMQYGITGVRSLTVHNAAATAPVASLAARVRALSRERFQTVIGDTWELAMAMLLGDRNALAGEDQAAFQRAGIAHLMSVSGLHVGLLAMALLWIMRRAGLRKGLRFPVAAVFLAFYCTLTGFSAASVRASVMTLVWLLAQAAGRKPDPLTTLSAALLAVLVINPLQLFSAGFALSFLAIGGMLLLYQPLRAALTPAASETGASGRGRRGKRWSGKVLGKTRDWFAGSLSAQAGVLLPTAEAFHRLPLYGILFNLLAVPLASLLVPLYAVTLLMSLLPGIGGWLGRVPGFAAGMGGALLRWFAHLSDSLPYAQVRVPSPNLWAYAGMLLCAVAVSRYVRAGAGRRALAVALTVLIACAGAYLTRPAAVRYHQFAVGQGDAALMVDHGFTVGIDVGPDGGEITERLLAEGRDLDLLILTHLHADHALGLQSLLDAGIGIRRVCLPQGVQNADAGAEAQEVWDMLGRIGIPIETLAAGDCLTFDELSIEVLWPQAGHTRAGTDANERSMATLLRLGGLRILSMADNSQLYEPYIAVPCDVLKVGHHGSRAATSEALLNAAAPALALVTCRSGAALPAEETMARLAEHGVCVLRTDRTGEIILEATAAGYRARTYLAEATDEP